ncbi:MAG: lipocalin family protein [Muribaculaceae bacterium]|nr:lipocalin family protein [Muribaculaceae bacterium]
MYKKVLNYFVIITVALFTACAMTACNDDDDEDDLGGGSGSKGGIVGEWLLTRAQGWEKENGKIVDEWDENFDSIYEYTVYKFRSNGTVEVYLENHLEDRAKYTLKGNKLAITYVEDGEQYTETCDCKISGDNMKITTSEKEIENGVTYEYYEELYFERLED